MYVSPSHKFADKVSDKKTTWRVCRLSLLPFAFLIFFLSLPHLSEAAGLAEDHTVLYYLVEMQRRQMKNCNGTPVPEAPSLLPSETLRGLAREHAASGMFPASRIAESGLSNVPHFITVIPGQSPKQAMEALMADQCQAVMGQQYHYIGAARQEGMWILILAASEPAPSLMSQPQTVVAPSSDDNSKEALLYAPATPGGPEERMNPAPATPIVVGQMTIAATGEYLPPVKTTPGADAHQERGVTSQQPTSAPRPGVTPLHEDSLKGLSGGIGVFAATEQGGAASGQTPFISPVVTSPAIGQQAMPLTGQVTGFPATTDPLGNVAPNVTGQLHDGQFQSAKLLQLVNAARASGQVCDGTRVSPMPALRNNLTLAGAASAHARDMTARRYFSSTTPEGVTLGQRVSGAGYSWAFVAENLAARSASAERTLQSWLNNPDQCRNLMGQEYQEAGIGLEPAGLQWVMTLATSMEGAASLKRHVGHEK